MTSESSNAFEIDYGIEEDWFNFPIDYLQLLQPEELITLVSDYVGIQDLTPSQTHTLLPMFNVETLMAMNSVARTTFLEAYRIAHPESGTVDAAERAYIAEMLLVEGQRLDPTVKTHKEAAEAIKRFSARDMDPFEIITIVNRMDELDDQTILDFVRKNLDPSITSAEQARSILQAAKAYTKEMLGSIGIERDPAAIEANYIAYVQQKIDPKVQTLDEALAAVERANLQEIHQFHTDHPFPSMRQGQGNTND